MKRILCFIDSLGAGGAQRQLVGLAKELRLKGYDVTIVVYTDIHFYLPEVINNNIPYIYIRSAHKKMYRIYGIAKYIKQEKPDCVISYLETPSLIMSIIKIFYNEFKLIVSERNTTQTLTYKDRLRFFLYRNADYIVSNSFTQNDFIKNHFPKLKNKCVSIVNFVDTTKFVKSTHKKSTFVTFVVAASISRSKNLLNFIRSLRIVLNENYTNFTVRWFGIVDENNSYYLSCRRCIEENNLGTVISLLPKTLHIVEEYAKADFFCLPSLYEGTPNALLEALSCGIPSICSDVSDNAHYVKDNYNGFLFNPTSIESMAHAVIKCLEMTDDTYYKFSERSRRIVEEQLSVKKFLDSYVNLIEK